MRSIEEINQTKYLIAPTIEQIDSFVKECGASYYGFERYFGLPKGTLKLVKFGQIRLPIKYWHIIFERKKTKPKPRSIKKVKNNLSRVKETVKLNKTESSHTRLNTLK